MPLGGAASGVVAPAPIRSDRLAHGALLRETLRKAAAIEVPPETLVAHPGLLAHHLDEGRDRLGAARLSAPPSASSSRRPYPISTPPEEGGGFDSNSCPR